MSIAGVIIKEIDLTTRVPAFEGVYVAACFQTKRGDVDPFLVSNEAQFLRKTTLNDAVEVGFDLGYYSVLAALQKTDKVWIKRVLGTGYLYGGASVEVAGAATDNVVLVAGESDPTAFTFTAEAFMLYAKDPGDWSDDIGFKLWVYHTNESIDVVTGVDYATDKLTVIQKWVDCEPVRLIIDTDGTFPIGLAKDTTYYTIKDTTTTVKLATSAANATLGTAIDLVDVNEITNGTTTSTTADKLVDSAGSFVLDGVEAGDVVENTTDGTFATVTAIDSLTTLSLDVDIMTTGEDYIIYNIGGTATSTVTDKLVDTAADFVTDEIAVGDVVLNLTDTTSATITAIDSLTTLSLDDDIIVSGDIYRIQRQGTITMIPMKEVKESGAFMIEVFKSTNETTPIETFTCSRVEGTKDGYGQNIYVEDRLQASEYVRVLDNTGVTDTVMPQTQAIILYLDKGADGAAVTDSQMILAADAFSNKLDKPMTVFIDCGWTTTAYQIAIANICANRQDSVAILSTPYASEISSSYLNDLVDYRNNTLNLGGSVGSYAALYAPHVKIRDKYNDRDLFVSPDGYAAAAISYTAYNYEMWYPVSGFKRGMLFNVLDLNIRFDEAEMSYLYENEVNPYRYYPGKGIMIWGQKTLYGIPSILDRLNTRLLLIVLEPAIAEALETFIWDLNNTSTRAIAKNMVDNYMEGIKARDGVTDFYTICNDTNNLDTDIENHIMNLDLFVKPTPSLEYINFTTILTPQGMSFEIAQTAV
jgi:hypothetical protein